MNSDTSKNMKLEIENIPDHMNSTVLNIFKSKYEGFLKLKETLLK